MNRKLSIIMLLLAVLFVSQSCKKEDAVKQENNNTNQLLGAPGGGDETEAKIVKFFKRMNLVRKNPNYPKSENWNYKKDSTVWYIEAALNYKYAYNWKYTGNKEHSDLYNVDSSFVKVSGNSSRIFNIVALQASYDKLAASLETQYSGIEAENKFFVLSDIMDLSSENGSLSLMQYSVISKANQASSNNDWKWGSSLGDCSGNHIGLDATNIIENKLSLSRAILPNAAFVNIGPTQTQNNGYIYPDEVPLASGVPNPTPFWDYLLFKYTNQGGDPCLSNSDMNWYRSNILSIENTYRPSGKGIIYTNIESSLTVSSQSSIIVHYIYPLYGEWHIFHYTDPID